MVILYTILSYSNVRIYHNIVLYLLYIVCTHYAIVYIYIAMRVAHHIRITMIAYKVDYVPYR